MKKVLNFRPLFYCFIAFGLGIVIAKFFFDVNLFVIISCATILCLFIFFAIKFKFFKRFLIVLAAFGVGVLANFFSVTSFTGAKNYVGEHEISARINTISSYQFMQNALLDNVYVDGSKLGASIMVTIKGVSDFSVGDIMTFSSELDKTSLYELGNLNSYIYKYNIKYESTVSCNDVTIDKSNSLYWSERLRNNIKKYMDENMGDSASVAYSCLFGDKSYIPASVRDNFSKSGIAHLLAVSGLHVGFVVALLSFLLKKLNVKNYIQTIIIGIILLLYCTVCDFSVSVVRASVMFLVLSLSSLFGEKYDRLNSLGLAGLILLIAKPLYIYDLGFILSFASVFCIFTISPLISDFFDKIHMPKFLKPFTIILSTQIGLLPIIAVCSGTTSLLALLANFICIPIFELFFMLLFSFGIIVLILPFMAFILKLPAILLTAIMYIAEVVASVEWAIIDLSSLSSSLIFIIYVVIFIFSYFINLTIKHKLLLSSIVVIFAVLIAAGNNMPVVNNFSIDVLNSYDDLVYCVDFNGTLVAFGDFNKHSVNLTQSYVNDYKHKSIDYLFYFDNAKDAVSKFNNAYTFNVAEGDGVLMCNKEYSFSSFTVKAIYFDSAVCAVGFVGEEKSVLYVRENVAMSFVNSLLNKDDYDILICYGDQLPNVSEFNIYAIVGGENVKSDNFKSSQKGNWTLKFNGDEPMASSID